MQASLSVSGNVPKPFDLQISHTLSIGRAKENLLSLPANDRLSRYHALLRCHNAGVYQVVDLGSKNGTYVDGKRAFLPTPLKDGSKIETGDVTMVFRLNGDGSLPGSSEPADVCLLVLEWDNAGLYKASIEPHAYSQLLGRFFRNAVHHGIERGGWIDKFRERSLLLYWEEKERKPSCTHLAMESALEILKSISEMDGEAGLPAPRAGATLHYGKVLFPADLYELGEPVGGETVDAAFELSALRMKGPHEILATEACLASLPEQYLLRLQEHGTMRPTKTSPSLRVFVGH